MEKEISGSDFIIAITTDRNPHVFFEMALAYAARKPCIVMAEKEEDFEIFRKTCFCMTYDTDLVGMRRRLREELVRLIGEDADTTPVTR